MNKVCPQKSKFAGHPDYICNPLSGKWVLKTGPTGKKILASKKETIVPQQPLPRRSTTVPSSQQKTESIQTLSQIYPNVPSLSQFDLTKSQVVKFKNIRDKLSIQLKSGTKKCFGSSSFDVHLGNKLIGSNCANNAEQLIKNIETIYNVYMVSSHY